MRDTVSTLLSIDDKEPGVFIDMSLKGLFPDNDFRVVMPKDHWHLPAGQHPKSVEITLEEHNKILVRAFDEMARPVTTCSDTHEVEIPLSEDNLSGARFNIQCALGQFNGIPLSHTGTHKKLSVNLG